MDPLEAVADVRNRMGYAPLPSPLVIQGDAPPPPPFEPETGPWEDDVIRKMNDDLGSASGEESPQAAAGQGPPPSPLIPVRTRPRVAAPVPEPVRTITVPVSDLIVSGYEAIFKGQAYRLDQQGVQEISVAILRAAKRQAEQQMSELVVGEAAKPIRLAKPATPALEPKKRGRPKGSKNKPKEAANVEPVGTDEVPS